MLKERLAFWSALAEDQGRPWDLYGTEEPAKVPVAAADLSAVIDATLGNVFRHTPERTAFTVTLHQGSGHGRHPHRRRRAGHRRPGGRAEARPQRRGSTGLGLDIARRLAESTGGHLKVDRSPLGGAAIQIWLRTTGPRPARRLLRRAGH